MKDIMIDWLAFSSFGFLAVGEDAKLEFVDQ